MKKLFALPFAVLAMLALVLITALAQPGDLDPTWGDQGVTHTSFGEGDDVSTANALMEDGKWVLSGWVNVYPGDFGAARYLTNGELDPDFGEDGLVVTSFTDDPELVDASWATGERPNGGLFLQGETCDADYIVCELAVAAYLEDGTLDPSFGDDGLVTTDPGTAGALSWPGRLIAHSDGSLTTGGVVFQDDNSVDMVMVRYNADGSLDDSFGEGGIAIFDLAGDDDFLSDMLALPGDKILATGAFATPVSSTWAEPVVGVLARMNGDGSLDATFGGGDGFVTWESGGDTTGALASLITPDNQIMVFGFMGTPDGRDCFLRRYDIDGELDTSFGEDGQVTIDSGQDDDCREMALTPDNKLALAWAALPFAPEARATTMTTRRDVALSRLGAQNRQGAQVDSFGSVLARYNLDGTPDTSFGLNGLRRYSETEVGVFYQLAVQPDGKYLAGGDFFADGFVDFGAVRFVDTQSEPAQPGDLDPTWGNNGLTLTDFDGLDDYANASALMDDGRWVIAGWANIFPGDFGVVRYLANGRLDPSFGDGGKVVTSFTNDPELVDAAWQAAARSNGGIFAIGETCDADYIICQLAVAAYMADGSLDESFGDDGLVVTDPGTANAFSWAGRPIVQPDGKLVVGGIVFQDDDAVDLLFVRYHPDGSLDDTFGDSGISIIDLAGVDNFVNDIVPLPGNKFLALGGFGAFVDPVSSVPSDAGFLAQVNSDGSMDMTFGGGDGYITWDNDGELTEGRQGLITSDNKILVLGHMAADDGSDCSLQRYNMDGNLDTTFGDEGLVVIDTGQYDECLRMALTPDGKLVIAGPAAPAPEEDPAALAAMSERTSRRPTRQSSINRSAQDEPFENLIARYNLDGTPDATFGQNGQVRFSINAGAGLIYQLAVQRDGKILVAGDVLEGDFFDIGALRFLGDGPAAQVYAPVIRR